ncbi:MAG: hypothetical protein M3O88_00735 [Actinomycetota bacterium]|nr:hypothetical protein [Actinomycetota bacterium]
MNVEEARIGLASRQEALADLRSRIAEERARIAGALGADRTVATRMLDLQEALASAESSWLAAFRKEIARLRR